MPHLYPAETVTYMKRKKMDLPPCIAIATDYTCIPFWEETECDYYIVPHEDSFVYELSHKLKNGEQLIIICGNNRKMYHTSCVGACAHTDLAGNDSCAKSGNP